MKATHQGECQICGSVQMLPSGKLSKHGYTVQCGFFNGVCAGAHRLPFEQSTDAIAPVVASVEETIRQVAAQIARLRDKNSDVNGLTVAQIKSYNSIFGYVWEQREIKQETHPASGGGTYTTARSLYEKTTATGQKHQGSDRIENYDYSNKLETQRDWVHFCNCKFAEDLAKTNSQRRTWVKWQQERLKNWKPKPLTPRGGGK